MPITKALCTDATTRRLKTGPGEMLRLEDPEELLKLEQMVDLGDARLHAAGQELSGYTHWLFTRHGDTFMVRVEGETES